MSEYIKDRVNALDERDLIQYFNAIKKRLMERLYNHPTLSDEELLECLNDEQKQTLAAATLDIASRINAVKFVRETYGIGIKAADEIVKRANKILTKG